MWFFHNFIFTEKRFGTSFLDMLKIGLTELGVTFTDTCVCPTPMNIPMGTKMAAPTITDNELNLEMFRSMFEEIQSLKQEVKALKDQINNQ